MNKKERNLYDMPKNSFLSALHYNLQERKRRLLGTWWGKIGFWTLVGLCFGVFIGAEVFTHNYQCVELYLFGTTWILTLPFIWFPSLARTLMGWLGFDGNKPTIGSQIWYWVGIFLAVLVACFYVLDIRGIALDIIGPTACFGLAQFANELASHATLEPNRSELMRISQKFIVAGSCFALFEVTDFFLMNFQKSFGQIDLNKFSWGSVDISRGIIFWLCALTEPLRSMGELNIEPG